MPASSTTRIATLAAGAVLTLLATASASSPGTSYIFPAGAQRGTTVRVIVGGRYLYEACAWNMLGTGVSVSKQITLAERQVWFEGPRIPMPASQAGDCVRAHELTP